MRDTEGKWRKGTSGNPGGRRREGSGFEAAARRVLEGEVDPATLEIVPAAARALLPSEPTYQDALASVLIASGLAGDIAALRELLKRLWPALRPVALAAEPLRVEIDHEPPRHTLPPDPEGLAEVINILLKYDLLDQDVLKQSGGGPSADAS